MCIRDRYKLFNGGYIRGLGVMIGVNIPKFFESPILVVAAIGSISTFHFDIYLKEWSVECKI